jgi:hypothetical protein
VRLFLLLLLLLLLRAGGWRQGGHWKSPQRQPLSVRVCCIKW